MATVAFPGLDELRAELRALPDALTQEAGAIVLHAAQSAEAEILGAYPDVSGRLRGGVRVKTADAGRFGAAAQVVNTAKLAWIWEDGTEARHVSLLPAGRVANFGIGRGSTPPHHVFIPRVMAWRRWMWDALAALVRSHGLEVTGEP